jgi:hypothetical protein
LNISRPESFLQARLIMIRSVEASLGGSIGFSALSTTKTW